jgi:hypothetical protein
MSQRKFFLCLGLACILAVFLTGCTAPLRDRVQVASKACQTENSQINPEDEVVVDAAEINGGLTKPNAVLLGLRLKKKNPQLQSEKRIEISPAAGYAVPKTAAKSFTPPQNLSPAMDSRNKKAMIRPPAAPVTPAPTAQPKVVVTERSFYPEDIPLGTTGGTTEADLIAMGKAALGAAGPMLSGVFMPGMNVVTNATGGKGGRGGTGQGGAGGQGGQGGKGGNAWQQQGQDQAQGQSQGQAQDQTMPGKTPHCN